MSGTADEGHRVAAEMGHVPAKSAAKTEEERREEAELGGFGCDFFLDDLYGWS